MDSESTGSATALVDAENPWGLERRREPPLDGVIAEKVSGAARAEVPDGTIVRVATDADGRAAYAASMTRADGTPVTVYVNEQLEVVSVGWR